MISLEKVTRYYEAGERSVHALDGVSLEDLAAFPLIYPNAGVVPQESYAYEVMQQVKPPFWDGTKMNMPPVFSWGGRIGNTNQAPSPPAISVFCFGETPCRPRTG